MHLFVFPSLYLDTCYISFRTQIYGEDWSVPQQKMKIDCDRAMIVFKYEFTFTVCSLLGTYHVSNLANYHRQNFTLSRKISSALSRSSAMIPTLLYFWEEVPYQEPLYHEGRESQLACFQDNVLGVFFPLVEVFLESIWYEWYLLSVFILYYKSSWEYTPFLGR